MSDCGCEGSCPICDIGEVDNHKCNRCEVQFCIKCHGILNGVKSENVLPCKCKMKHRYRLYEVPLEGFPGSYGYCELWDYVEYPMDASNEPKREILLALEDHDKQAILRAVSHYKEYVLLKRH